LRVISGTARGCKLVSQEGNLTRPTTDRVKESLFSIIQFSVKESVVLDLFAGSGALGIETLSRGAKSCVFVEQNSRAVNIIKQNLEKTGLIEKSIINNTDAERFILNCSDAFDIIFLDPPYGFGICDKMLDLIKEKGIIKPNGIIVCETDAKDFVKSPFFEKKQVTYSSTKLTFFENR